MKKESKTKGYVNKRLFIVNINRTIKQKRKKDLIQVIQLRQLKLNSI